MYRKLTLVSLFALLAALVASMTIGRRRSA